MPRAVTVMVVDVDVLPLGHHRRVHCQAGRTVIFAPLGDTLARADEEHQENAKKSDKKQELKYLKTAKPHTVTVKTEHRCVSFLFTAESIPFFLRPVQHPQVYTVKRPEISVQPAVYSAVILC